MQDESDKHVMTRRYPHIVRAVLGKLVNTRMVGIWEVILKDGQGQVLDSRRFKLVTPPEQSECVAYERD